MSQLNIGTYGLGYSSGIPTQVTSFVTPGFTTNNVKFCSYTTQEKMNSVKQRQMRAMQQSAKKDMENPSCLEPDVVAPVPEQWQGVI